MNLMAIFCFSISSLNSMTIRSKILQLHLCMKPIENFQYEDIKGMCYSRLIPANLAKTKFETLEYNFMCEKKMSLKDYVVEYGFLCIRAALSKTSAGFERLIINFCKDLICYAPKKIASLSETEIEPIKEKLKALPKSEKDKALGINGDDIIDNLEINLFLLDPDF